MIESGMVGINVLVERNWTWVSGNTYPVKEELKAQGFYWSTKRRAWYNRRVVEVKLNNNGNGHKDTFVKEKATTKNTLVMVKAKEKTLEQEVFEYIKTKEAYPLISGEWLLKQEKLGKTFLQLKPQIDDLIEEFLETEKRVKEQELSEHEKALIEGNYKIEGKILTEEIISEKDPDIQKISEIVSKSNELHQIDLNPEKRMEELYND